MTGTPHQRVRRRRAAAWLRGLRGLPARTPLRVTLVAAVLALVTLALAVTGVTGVLAVRSFLLDRVDEQLRATARAVADRPSGPDGPGRPPGPRGGGDGDDYGRPALSTAFYVQTTTADGVATSDLRVPEGQTQTPPALPRLDTAGAGALAGRPFTVPARGAGHDWRVLVTVLPDGSSAAVAVALDDVDTTVDRLVGLDVVLGLAVLALLGALGHTAVRSSLRRLVEVETTAGAIAAGDLTRRVPDADERTEVGRLARALNVMLARIESAFRAQEASEASARASEERMRRFVADASHELRTPLTSIRGFAELHRQGAVAGPADTDRVMRRIESEAARMGLLVDDLLLLARLDQQRPLARTPVDLLTLAADAVSDAKAVAPDRPVALELTSGPDAPPPVVLGDEARLRQVVGNLVSNALTHTPPGTAVTVRVGSAEGSSGSDPAAPAGDPADDRAGGQADDRAGDQAGVQAVLEVADTGPGLAPDDAARVFERFYRADPSRTRAATAASTAASGAAPSAGSGAHGGAGLGLSIVSALVAAHGGTVELRTAPGAGASFRVLLPLASASSPVDPVPLDR